MGDGIEENIADGYTFLMNNYEPGDKIFLFGFSRGAYTARVLANFICRVGIFRKPAFTWSFKKAFKLYKEGKLNTDEDIRKQKWWDRDTLKTHEVEIEVVGCWDTVASLGGPLDQATNLGGVSGKYEHFDGSLLKGVSHGITRSVLAGYRANDCKRRRQTCFPCSSPGRMPTPVLSNVMVLAQGS